MQATWRRIPPRGPWRLALLVGSTALLITVGASMISALLAVPNLLGLLLSLVVLLASAALLGRAWAMGTSVSDAGVKVSRLRTTVLIPWTDVREVEQIEGSRWLGLPRRIDGWTVTINTPEGDVVTHIASASPDLWGRPQASAAAADALRTWWRETR